jgi:uncharacterized membrane protein
MTLSIKSLLILFHVCAATVGLLSGFVAIAFRKGSGRHSAAGMVFVVSMLGMSSSAAVIAAFIRPNMINVLASLLTFYLVSTGWYAARRREQMTGSFDRGALLFIAMVATGGYAFGIQAVRSGTGKLNGIPSFFFFIFASVALLCVFSDVRMLRRGGLVGTQRLARHLWRMCVALLLATLSFYPGQARLFPMSWRATKLLFIPHVILIGSLIFWAYRVRVRKRARPENFAPTVAVPAMGAAR